jgi:TetR/AcrR family transcriptional repressor of nem operon
MKAPSVRDQLLEHALVLLRRRGFNGFSYRDLAELVGVKTSSIHYHFPTKEDLVLAAVTEYSNRVASQLRAIDDTLPSTERARRYLKLWHDSANGDLICLAGMLSTEAMSLPESVHRVLKDFYTMNEAWIVHLLGQSSAPRDNPLPLPPKAIAQAVFATLQNGLIASRLFGTAERLDAADDLLMATVAA